MILHYLDSVHKLCYKDLTEEVIRELKGRIEVDSASAELIRRSLGIIRHITVPSIKNVVDVFAFSPNTPVELLKDVFEALQLYDLVDLLEEPANPPTVRPLRLALPLDEIRKLRNEAGRPISYHSRAAVLIFADDRQDSSVKEIETFFKDLNLNSKVTVIQCSRREKRWEQRFLLQNSEGEISWINEQLKTAKEHAAITALKSGLQSNMELLDLVEEDKNALRAALMVIDEWIQCQGWCKLCNTFI